MNNPETIGTIWNVINTGGVIAVLLLFVVLLVKGDLIPRKTYDDLTKRVLKEICTEIVLAIRAMLRDERDWRDDHIKSSAHREEV